MKRKYLTPELEIFKFTLSVSALTASVTDHTENITEDVEELPGTPVKPKPFGY